MRTEFVSGVHNFIEQAISNPNLKIMGVNLGVLAINLGVLALKII